MYLNIFYNNIIKLNILFLIIMQQINIYFQNYKIIIYLIIFFLFVRQCTFYSSDNTKNMTCNIDRSETIENMTCDIDRPKDTYISTNLNHLIKDLNLDNNNIKLLYSLFDINNFKQNGYNSDNMSIDNFININEVTNMKEIFITAINIILNNNRMWDNINEYKLTLNNSIATVRHIWLLDILLSDLYCNLSLIGIKDNIKNIMNDRAVKLCNQQELINYCISETNNTMDEFNDEEYNMFKNKPILNFKLISLKESIKNFGEGYYKEPLNTILLSLLKYFEERYLRKLDKFNREDIKKLLLIYIPIIKVVINKKINNSSNSYTEKKQINTIFEIHKELFYLLKHQYKIISIYNMINELVVKSEDKELAYKCCVDTLNKNNMCYNFKQSDTSNPIIYGFNKYGYAKNTSCTLETKKNIFDLQKKSLEVRLSTDKNWITLANNIKQKFYINLSNLLNYFIPDKLDSSIQNMSIVSLLNKTKNINMNQVFPDNLNTIKINIDDIIDSNTKNVIESLQLASNIITIMKLANNNNLTDNDFDFKHMYIVNNTESINKIKFAVIKLIELRRLFIVFKANKHTINHLISKVLAISPTDYNYYTLLLKGGIQPRFHKNIIDYLYKMLSDVKLIKIEPITLESKPYEVIKYIEKIFPSSKDINVCNNYKYILTTLRNNRKITPNEYIKYSKKLTTLCDNVSYNLSTNKPILYIDEFGKTIEIAIQNMLDYKNKNIFVMTTVNKDGNVEIVNYDSNEKNVKYSGILIIDYKLVIKQGIVQSNLQINNEIEIMSVNLDNNNNKVFTPTKISMDTNIDSNIKIDNILDENDENKDLLNLINNYF